MQAIHDRFAPNQFELGKRFRMAVTHALGQSGKIAPDAASSGWTIYNSTPVIIRYSRCRIDQAGANWFYGLTTKDSTQLEANGALLLVAPHVRRHQFILLGKKETAQLLTRCKGSERGDLKIHLFQRTMGAVRLREWKGLDLRKRTHFLSAATLARAELTQASGVSHLENRVGQRAGHIEIAARSTQTQHTSRPARPIRRTGREFDTTFVPMHTSRSAEPADPSKALARREQSHRAHQRLVGSLNTFLKHAGWTDVEALPGAIDLWGRHPRRRLRVIFECKSTGVIPRASELEQSRSGLAQLLEYRFDYGEPSDALCLVTDGALSNRRIRFLETLGIACISIRGEAIECLGTRARRILGRKPILT